MIRPIKMEVLIFVLEYATATFWLVSQTQKVEKDFEAKDYDRVSKEECKKLFDSFILSKPNTGDAPLYYDGEWKEVKACLRCFGWQGYSDKVTYYSVIREGEVPHELFKRFLFKKKIFNREV